MKFKKLILYVLLLTYFCKSIYSYDFVLKEIIDLDAPWGLSFIDDNQLIITEKSGYIKLFNIITHMHHSITLYVFIDLRCIRFEYILIFWRLKCVLKTSTKFGKQLILTKEVIFLVSWTKKID